MFGPRFRNSIFAMMALVLLSLAVASRAPQSKCRCHQRKGAPRSQTQDQKPCVFGQMRSLTANYVLPATVEPEEKTPRVFIPIIHFAHIGLGSHVESSDYPRARSPPLFA